MDGLPLDRFPSEGPNVFDLHVPSVFLDFAYMLQKAYGLETVALTEQQHRGIQVCENNWINGTYTVKRVARRIIKTLKENTLEVKFS